MATLTNIKSYNVAGAEIANEVDEKKVRGIAFEILSDHVLCSMASVTPENHAHINTAYFSFSDDLVVYFLSYPDSLHCQNLSKNPSMAVAVFSSSQNWMGPDRGIQLFGDCNEAKGLRAKEAVKLYSKRFRDYAEWKANLKRGDPALAYRFYRFLIRSLKILDEKNFGEAVFVSAGVRRHSREA